MGPSVYLSVFLSVCPSPLVYLSTFPYTPFLFQLPPLSRPLSLIPFLCLLQYILLSSIYSHFLQFFFRFPITLFVPHHPSLALFLYLSYIYLYSYIRVHVTIYNVKGIYRKYCTPETNHLPFRSVLVTAYQKDLFCSNIRNINVSGINSAFLFISSITWE